MDAAYEDLLEALGARPGMFVLAPRFLTAAALLQGFSRGCADDVAEGFQDWLSRRHPAAGGHPNPVAYEVVLAEDWFHKEPQDLDADEERQAVSWLVDLMRHYLAEQEQ